MIRNHSPRYNICSRPPLQERSFIAAPKNMNIVPMDQVDDRTFRVNFSIDGLMKLKDRIENKLQEFMGDYADDSLVEYVIVLISNGRQKEEAKCELDVFLGDDCDSFVSWLWDHLTSNINQYAESQVSIPDEIFRSSSPELGDTNNLCYSDPDKEHAECDKEYSKRHRRKWRARMSSEFQQPALDSCVVGKVESETIASRSGNAHRSASPNPPEQRKRKRSRSTEHERPKLIIGAPRRLLQFAVRDALATANLSTSVKERRVKRLRSVVSSPNSCAAQNVRPHRMHSTTRGPDTIAVAVNPVAETVYVGKATPSSSVFGQLNHGAEAPESTEEVAKFKDNVAPEDMYYHYYDELMDYYHRWEMSRQRNLEQGDYSGGKYVDNATMLRSDNGLASSSAFDSKRYDGTNVINDRLRDVTQTGSRSGRKTDNSHMSKYSMARKDGQLSPRAQLRVHDPPVSAANASRKVLDISVNVNTLKQPHYQSTNDDTELTTRRSNPGSVKEHRNSVTLVGNGKAATQTLEETIKSTTCEPGLNSTGGPLDISDNRTIFVNNVHFAATVDTLSWHFSKFGEVWKVTILTDAATGQPKGSAYVEFKLKDAAENALSLDGTSFMSRILKVVKKGSGHQEVSASMICPRVSRNLPIARFSRAPVPAAKRAWPPAKRGIRSMQWMRNTQPSTALQGVSSVLGNKSNATTGVGRGLTYVRGEAK